MTATIGARAVAAGCRTVDRPGAWAALVDRIRGKARSNAASALASAGSVLCHAGIVAFTIAESDPRPDPQTNNVYVASLPKTLSHRRALSPSCRADRHCSALVAAADVLATAAATFGTSSLELAVARNRFATAMVNGKKNDAALQKALLVLEEGNVARAQQDADAAERALALHLQAAGVDARLAAAAFAPVLAAVRSGRELPPSAVAATRDARLDATELTTRLGALPLLSADLRIGDVWTRSGVSRRQAVRRKLTLTELQRIVPNLLVPLGTRTTKTLIADLQALSSACSQRARTLALQGFRRDARGLTSTRMLDTAVDPIVIKRRRCG